MRTTRKQDLPEYVFASIGEPDLGCVANRVREMAAMLSAQGLENAATHLIQAYGSLLGVMAHRPARVARPA